ncbi:ChrR family anti-sigma-E factor [Alteromonas flava]|uniref:ChrR family anti-sigma-E factor n=1 Tax=Alteromonas flava TaxID=2048003 RepID=UPI000C28D8A9|nr:ChrR family anti-sigma-E factor [Alteromonas flava]
MINFHPNLEHIRQFAEGTLAPASALLVSAHCDMCPRCMELARNENSLLANEAFSASEDDPRLDRMLGSILEQPVAEHQAISAPLIDTIELDGRSFKLPRALQRYAKSTGNWSSLVGKLWQAPVDLGDIGVANFIYMEKGGRVPEHTHKGSELTLVINGEFSDGISHYDSGDFIALTGEHTHAPFSEAEEGCLVFSIVDKPLHFTSGLARLLNPFSQLFFK